MELSEIIKGLRCCAKAQADCTNCPFVSTDYCQPDVIPQCFDDLKMAAADALEMQRNHIVALTEQLKEARNEQS